MNRPAHQPEGDYFFRLSLSQRGLILVTVPLFFLVSLITVLIIFLSQIQDAALRESQSKELIYQSQLLFQKLGDGVRDLMGSLAHTDGMEHANVVYLKKMRGKVDEFAELCRARQYSEPQLIQMKDAWQELISVAETLEANSQVIAEFRKTQPKRVLDKKVLAESSRIFDTLDNIRGNEKKKLVADRHDINQLQQMILITLVAGTAASLLASAFLAWLYAVAIKAPIARIENNSRLLSLRLPLDEPMEGVDEFSRLDQLVHHVDEEVEQALARERSLFENAADMICTLEADGTFSQVNPHSTRMLGYAAEQLQGHSVLHITVSDQRLHADEELARARSQLGTSQFELRLKHRDGAEIDTRWTAFWSAEEDRLFCVVHDISEQNEVARMKEEFLAIVSGRLRDPLAAMQSSMSRVCAQGELPARASREITVIEKNIKLLVTLVDDLLNFQNLSVGKVNLHLEQCNLDSVIRNAHDLVEFTASAKKVKLDLPQGSWIVTADSVKLTQALVNLLANAIRYSPEGGTVSVQVNVLDSQPSTESGGATESGDETVTAHAGILELTVSDNGPGVPEEYRKKVFDAFEQVPATQSSGFKGTGLGLSICKTIVEAHGGSVGVQANEPCGSTFFICIPHK